MSIRRCCCVSGVCQTNQSSWTCSQATTEWFSSINETFSFDVDMSSTQTFGSSCVRTRNIYVQGAISGSRNIENKVQGTVSTGVHQANTVSVDASIVDSTSPDYLSSTYGLLFDAYWIANSWAQVTQTGCSDAPECSPFDIFKCDEETVTENRMQIATSGGHPETSSPSTSGDGDVFYWKKVFLLPETEYTAGCATKFTTYQLTRRSTLLHTRRVRKFVSGLGQVSDTGWTTVYNGDLYLLEEATFYRFGFQNVCNSFRGLSTDRWVGADGFDKRGFGGVLGLSLPTTRTANQPFRWLCHYPIDLMMPSLGGGFYDWASQLGINRILESSEFPISLPYTHTQTDTGSTYPTGWTVNSMNYEYTADANHYGVT